jgi:hypothetical protein
MCYDVLFPARFVLLFLKRPVFFAFRHAHVAEGRRDVNETSMIPAPILSPEDTEKLPSISLQDLQASNGGTLEVLNVES